MNGWITWAAAPYPLMIHPAPGFRGNFCAHFTRYYGHPAYKEFNLRDEGLEYTFPDTNEAAVFDDGTSYVAYAGLPGGGSQDRKNRIQRNKRQKNLSSRLKSFRRPMRKPISTGRKNTTITSDRRSMNSDMPVPTPYGVPDALERLALDPKTGFDPSMHFMTAKEWAHFIFESPELRILMMRGFLTSCGIYPDDVPGIMFAFATLHLVVGWETAAIAKGGTGSITESLVSAGEKLGVEYHINSEVDRLIIDNNKAKGIKLLDGTEIEAKQMVVSDNATPQLFSA